MAEPAMKQDDAPLKANAESRGHIYEGILETIGNTPLVRVSRFMEKYGLEADVLAKLEFFNPAGSVKDRIAYGMIEEAERSGKITPGKTVIIEPTSGNTGIGLALVCVAKGYRTILTMPESMSIERRKMLAYMGAELVLTPKELAVTGAIKKAEELAETFEDAFIPMQFANPANPQIHRETTAEEIWNDTDGKADILVSGVGTAGTITGVSQVIKSRKPEFKSYAVEPVESPMLSGGEHSPHMIQGIGAGIVPDIYDPELVDGIVQIDSPAAIETAREFTKLEAIPCGISGGAAMAAAREVARMPENKGKQIVVIIPSFAERYISTPLFEGLGE